MKRTFGKILSFALVLAMVLSMVPAVLAAPKVGDAQYLALGETANLTCTGAKYWVSSNPSAVSVTKTATGRATITALSTTSSGWGYGTATISAYEKESDYTSTNYADKNDALMTWSVTVSEWKVTLSFSGSSSGWNYGYGSSSTTTISAGEKKTLTATVTGPQGKVANAKVKFEVAASNKDMLHFDSLSSTGYSSTKDVTVSSGYSSTATSGTAAVDVYGGSKGGFVTITATIVGVDTSKNTNATTTITPRVIGPESWTVSLPTAQQSMTIKRTDYSQKLTPSVVTGSGSSAVSGAKFVYRFVKSENELENTSKYMQVYTDGSITPYQVTTEGPVRVRAYVEGYVDNNNPEAYPYAEAAIMITDSTANGLSIDYEQENTKFKMNNGTYVLAYKDTNNGYDVDFTDGTSIVTKFSLKATVDSTNAAADAKRVTWTTNDPERCQIWHQQFLHRRRSDSDNNGRGQRDRYGRGRRQEGHHEFRCLAGPRIR